MHRLKSASDYLSALQQTIQCYLRAKNKWQIKTIETFRAFVHHWGLLSKEQKLLVIFEKVTKIGVTIPWQVVFS